MSGDTPFPWRLAGVAVTVGLLTAMAFAGWAQIAGVEGAAWGVGILAYLLGCRHAFDIDHIAAIDNVTRRLRQDGKRPAAVGLYFSLGHSTVVLAATAALLLGGEHLQGLMPALRAWGAQVGAGVSASFLILIGLANAAIVVRMWKARSHGGNVSATEWELQQLLEQRGLMARMMRFAYRRTNTSRKMYGVGLLFGLGFDTASEIVLLALTAGAMGRYGLGAWSLLFLPLLFAAGMTLMDSACNLGMLKLYDWAMAGSRRTWTVNGVVTALSALLAFSVGAMELSSSMTFSPSAILGLGAGVVALWALMTGFARRGHGESVTAPGAVTGRQPGG